MMRDKQNLRNAFTPQRRQSGVTLVETLVALAVMGLTAASILTLIGQNTRFIISAEDRTYASIAADNIMVDALARETVDQGEETGETTIAGRTYTFSRRIEASPVEGLLVIDIDILDANGVQVLASATTLRREQ
ncbi:MAG: type II secretion system minor pseudopilin GspI [Pseudomonadota bacterium]